MLSRVAGNFYWMGRYIERANALSRLLLVQVNEIPEDSPDFVSSSWKGIFSSLNITPPNDSLLMDSSTKDDFLLADAYTLLDYLTFETHHQGSILSYLEKARENARQNQEKISVLIWPHINKSYLKLKSSNLQDIWPDKITELYKEILESSYLFYGLVQDSLYQNIGADFIELGKNVERFQNTASIFENHLRLLIMAHKKEQDDLVGLLLRCGAFNNYKQVHSLDMNFRKVIDFLIYNPHFTRSLEFCYGRIKKCLSSIQEKNQFNTLIYNCLDCIKEKLEKRYEGMPLPDFLNSLHIESSKMNQEIDSIYFNYKNLSSFIKNEQ